MRTYRRRVVMTLGIVAAAAAIGLAGSVGENKSQTVADAMPGSETPFDRSYVTGHRVKDSPEGQVRASLARDPHPVLQGTLSSVAVPSHDGRVIVYSTWEQQEGGERLASPSDQGVTPGTVVGTPVLRVHDLASGDDTEVARGAYSAALRHSGELAFFQATRPDFRAAERYVGHVVVADRIGEPAVPWTSSPDRYIVYAWARGTLLFYRMSEGERLTVMAASGPSDVRVLAEDATIVALSPDGGQVFLEHTNAEPRVSVVDVSTSDTVAELDLTDAVSEKASLPLLMYDGDWRGARVVAAGVNPDGPGVAHFEVSGNRIEAVAVDAFPVSEFPRGVASPRLNDSGRQYSVLASPGAGDVPDYYFLECDPGAECERRAVGRGDVPHSVENRSASHG